MADYFILCTGRSDRQVQSIAQGLQDEGAEEGIKPFAVEGTQRGHWALMDFSDVIVHIFYEPVREFYDLDGLWGDAPKARLPDSYAKLAGNFKPPTNSTPNERVVVCSDAACAAPAKGKGSNLASQRTGRSGHLGWLRH